MSDFKAKMHPIRPLRSGIR